MITGKITQGRSSFLDLIIEGRKLDATLRQSVRDLAARYEAQLKAELRRPKSGRMYGEQKGRTVYHLERRKGTAFGKKFDYTGLAKTTGVVAPRYRASAPGEAPATRTAAEVNAIRTKFPSQGKGYSARIYANRKVAFYRHWLEFGTAQRVQRKTGRGRARSFMQGNRNVGRVAPRPVFSPLQAKLEAELLQRVQRAADLFTTFGG